MWRLIFESRSNDGDIAPVSQSDTVGCVTSMDFANADCEVLDLSSQSLSRFMRPNIGDSNICARGYPYAFLRHNFRVAKYATRTCWARVKEALAEAHLPATQAFVAKQLGMSQPSVSEWNLEGGFPTIQNTISLSKLLNVNVEWLLTERGPKRPLPQDPAAQRLWDIWSQLDDVTKGELIGIASGRLQRSSEEVA